MGRKLEEAYQDLKGERGGGGAATARGGKKGGP